MWNGPRRSAKHPPSPASSSTWAYFRQGASSRRKRSQRRTLYYRRPRSHQILHGSAAAVRSAKTCLSPGRGAGYKGPDTAVPECSWAHEDTQRSSDAHRRMCRTLARCLSLRQGARSGGNPQDHLDHRHHLEHHHHHSVTVASTRARTRTGLRSSLRLLASRRRQFKASNFSLPEVNSSSNIHIALHGLRLSRLLDKSPISIRAHFDGVTEFADTHAAGLDQSGNFAPDLVGVLCHELSADVDV
jgi:hypothetical protein